MKIDAIKCFAFIGIFFVFAFFFVHESFAVAKKGKVQQQSQLILYTQWFGENSGYGYINKAGHIVIGPQFEEASDFKGELAAVKKEGKWGFIDKTGKFVMKPQFDGARDFSEGVAPVKKGDKWGYIDESGALIIECIYKNAFPFSNGNAGVTKLGTDQMFFIDKFGLKINYPNNKGYYQEMARHFGQYGLIAANDSDNNTHGFANADKKMVIADSFEGVENFGDGLAAVKKDGKWGFINANGEMVISPQYEKVITRFRGGLAIVNLSDGTANIDKSGSIVTTTASECGQVVVKNGAGKTIWPRNISHICQEYKVSQENERIEEQRRAAERRAKENSSVDYVSVTADITAGFSTCLVEGIKIMHPNGSADSNSPGYISEESSWWHNKTINRGYNGAIAGQYKYYAKIGNCSLKGQVCSGVVNVSGRKKNLRINFYSDCRDAGTNEY